MSLLWQQSSRHRGFTLVELLVTIAIAAVLLAVAVPSFRAMIQNNRAATMANEFRAALSFARSEAVKRGTSVSICAATNVSTSANPACGNASDWINGWLIYVGTSNPTATSLLKVRDAFTGGTVIGTSQAQITYAASGFPSAGAGSAGTYSLTAPGCVGTHGRQLQISTTGRVRISDISC